MPHNFRIWYQWPKALNESQVSYTQIEKKISVIVLGCGKLHQFIFVKKITIETDHKLLEAMLKRITQGWCFTKTVFWIFLDSFNTDVEAHVAMFIENFPRRDCKRKRPVKPRVGQGLMWIQSPHSKSFQKFKYVWWI